MRRATAAASGSRLARLAVVTVMALAAKPARAAAPPDAAPSHEAGAKGAAATPATAGTGTTVKTVPAKARLVWNPAWPRFRAWEYAGTILVGGASLYLHYHRVLPAQPRWQGDNPFDDNVRDWLRGGSGATRTRASNFSDVLQYYAPIVSYLADVPVILAVDHDVRLGWEILMMDLEANAVSGFITNTLFITAGRARPLYAGCAKDPAYDPLCGGSGANASFPSGHTITVGTAAGLMCAHHRYLPIYGSAVADEGACIFMILATMTTAVTRVVSDRHWASDTLFGAAVGFGSGYGLPWLLHYRGVSGSTDATVDRRPHDGGGDFHVAVIPSGGQRTIGLGVVGLF